MNLINCKTHRKSFIPTSHFHNSQCELNVYASHTPACHIKRESRDVVCAISMHFWWFSGTRDRSFNQVISCSGNFTIAMDLIKSNDQRKWATHSEIWSEWSNHWMINRYRNLWGNVLRQNMNIILWRLCGRAKMCDYFSWLLLVRNGQGQVCTVSHKFYIRWVLERLTELNFSSSFVPWGIRHARSIEINVKLWSAQRFTRQLFQHIGRVFSFLLRKLADSFSFRIRYLACRSADIRTVPDAV